MGKELIKQRKKEIVQVINHGFDGNARRSGKSESELFQAAFARLVALAATEEEVKAALHTARTAHAKLLESGRLNAKQAEMANKAVDEFEYRFRRERG